MTRGAVYAAIDAERTRQAAKWNGEHAWGSGDCSSRAVDEAVKSTVLTEECGEVARAVLDARHEDMRRELIQVAAVAVAWLEAFDEEEPSLWQS
jgi:hypothetical protein